MAKECNAPYGRTPVCFGTNYSNITPAQIGNLGNVLSFSWCTCRYTSLWIAKADYSGRHPNAIRAADLGRVPEPACQAMYGGRSGIHCYTAVRSNITTHNVDLAMYLVASPASQSLPYTGVDARGLCPPQMDTHVPTTRPKIVIY